MAPHRRSHRVRPGDVVNRLAAALLSLADVARERREAVPTMECGPTLPGPLSEILDRAERQQINQLRKEINEARKKR